ncbi:MAG: tetratricopeptide repeat protein [Myxococcota bacterium]
MTVIVAFVLIAAGASSQKGPGPKMPARQAFKKAEALYRVGEFERALEFYTHAYEKSDKPELLFNIGQCHMGLGDYRKASFYYEQYLRDVPKSRHRETVKALVVEANEREARAEEQRNKELERERLLAAKQVEEERARAAAKETERLQRLAEVAPPPAERRPVYKKWWFWTAVGGAVAVGAIATTIALSGGDDDASLGTLDRR